MAETTYGTWAEVCDVTKIAVSDTIEIDITSSYTGYIYNEVQNLWNAGERVYSAVMRHFTSMDPETGNVYEKMRVNAYVYAGNNPATYVDLNGRWFGSDVWNWIKDKAGTAWNWAKDTAGNVWNWVKDTANEAWDAVTGTFDAIACALKSEETQMALKLLLGSLGLAVGVAVTAATGGSVLPVLGMVVEGTIATGLFGAGMYTVSSAATGDWSLDGCLKAAGDSMLDGYMWSGLTAAAGSLYGWYKSGGTTAKYVGDDYYTGKSDAKNVTSTLGNEIDVTPSSNHSSVNKNPGPYGKPNTSVDILDANGNVKTRRWYDSDGKAHRDVDMSKHGNPKEHPEVPHEHTWEYNNGKPKRK